VASPKAPRRRRRPSSELLVGIAAILAVVAPIVLAVRLARGQGVAAERSRVRALAREVLRRTEATVDQTDQAIQRLVALSAGGLDPCSDRSLALMRNLDVSSDYIQAIGAVSGTVLRCDSVGSRRESVDLGPADVTTPRGVKVRTNVRLPFAPGQAYAVLERDGFATILHRDLAVDITTDPAVSLAVFATPGGVLVTARGRLDRAWLETAAHRFGPVASGPLGGEAVFTRDRHIIAVVASSRRYGGALSAVPTAAVDRRAQRAALLLVPVGAAAGLGLAAAVLYLARRRLGLPSILRTALRHGEFFLVYQPIVDLDTGRWYGAEALIRWRRRDGEEIDPDLFVPIAERCLNHRFTAHVLDLVAQDLADLTVSDPDFHLSVNLTPMDLQSPATVALVRRLIERTGVVPDRLTFETTERDPLDPQRARTVISELHACGVGVVIDDFGTGYSSLSYLQQLDVNALKIDRAFVESLGTEAVTNNVAFHIIAIAQELHLDMVAEGVEEEVQAEVLRQHGVRLAQGWLYSRALSRDELLLGLERTNRP